MHYTNLDTGFLFQSCLPVSALSIQRAMMNPKECLNASPPLTPGDCTWKSWEAEAPFENCFPLEFKKKNVAAKINNLTISNFCNLLITMMESLKMLDKGSAKPQIWYPFIKGWQEKGSSFYTFKDFCAICWQYYILIINCSSKEKMKNRDAKFKVIQIAKMNNA